MLHQSIQEFIEGWITRARSEGLAPGNPRKYKVIGSAPVSGVVAIQRTLIVSFEVPSLPTTLYPILLWIDAGTFNIFKSTNWRDTTPHWEGQSDWATLFDEYASGSSTQFGYNPDGSGQIFTDITPGGNGSQLSGATLTSPLYLSENPIAGNEAVTKAYVDNLVSTINAGGSPEYGPPVVTLADLQALDVTLIPNGQIRYVESMADIYGYSSTSSAVVDGTYVVQPTTGPGRWLSVSANNVTGGVF